MSEMRRTLQALTDAVANMKVPQTAEEAALQITVTVGPILQRAQKLLALPSPVDKPVAFDTVRRVCEGRASLQEGLQVSDYVRYLEGEIEELYRRLSQNNVQTEAFLAGN